MLRGPHRRQHRQLRLLGSGRQFVGDCINGIGPSFVCVSAAPAHVTISRQTSSQMMQFHRFMLYQPRPLNLIYLKILENLQQIARLMIIMSHEVKSSLGLKVRTLLAQHHWCCLQ